MIPPKRQASVGARPWTGTIYPPTAEKRAGQRVNLPPPGAKTALPKSSRRRGVLLLHECGALADPFAQIGELGATDLAAAVDLHLVDAR